MRVVCKKDDLMEGINIVQKAVSTKTTMQILEGILIEASGDKLKLTGNDLEMGIECVIEADILDEGSIVIISKIFGDIVRRLPDSEVSIEVRENNLVIIECENSHFEIKGLSPSGYPAIVDIEKSSMLTLSQKIVRDMIKQTIFAVGIDENRPILTGSLIECIKGNITFVSIDGFRLALRNSSSLNENAEFNAVVPGKTLNEIVKILQAVDDKVEIYKSSNQIMFDMGNCRVVSRLLEGEYLNYRNIIPNEHETKIRVDTKQILQSIERASLISAEDKKYPVKFSINDDKITISSNTEMGAVREEIRVLMNGEKIEIGFNPKYFIDALKVIEDEEVDIFFTSSVGPCTIRPIENEEYAYMILPVRIKSE